MLNGLDLFSGIGGISIALREWVRPVAYCENDRFAQAVLLSRMRDGELPTAPIWDDVTTLKAEHLPEPTDIIYGGFPCQDISVAGNGAGLEGNRSGLFFEIIRLLGELRPSFVFLENVPAITVRGLESVCTELTKIRYDCRWTIVSAAEMGAPHLRERWFLLAHSNDSRGGTKQIRECRSGNTTQLGNDGKEESMANTLCEGLERQRQEPGRVSEKLSSSFSSSWWEVEPSICRVVDGLQYRSHRIKCLGNAVIPSQAREAFMRLCGLNVHAEESVK